MAKYRHEGHYVLNTGKGQYNHLSRRIRRTKRRDHMIRTFNDAVERGLFIGPKFEGSGLVGVRKVHESISPEERKALVDVFHDVASLSSEATERSAAFLGRSKVNAKWSNFLENHSLRGGFRDINPTIEVERFKGKNIALLIAGAANLNKTTMEHLRVFEKMTPKEIRDNLHVQLRYFEAYMKRKKIKAMQVDAEESPKDSSTTFVRLMGNGDVVKETVFHIPSLNITETTIFTLRRNGKIELVESHPSKR